MVVMLQDRSCTQLLYAIPIVLRLDFMQHIGLQIDIGQNLYWFRDSYKKKYQFKKDIDDCVYWTDKGLFSLILATNPHAIGPVHFKLDAEVLHKAVVNAILAEVGESQLYDLLQRTTDAFPLWAKQGY